MEWNPHSLLPVAYRAALQVVRCRVLAEEAGERALHELTLATLQGQPPTHPKAWLRQVARRAACGLLRSDWGRTRAMEHGALQNQPEPEPRRTFADLDRVREALESTLSPRQRDALRAARCCNGTRAAARSCGMQPRDFRRSLLAITRKARALGVDELLALASRNGLC
jgi:hypothetical protein